MHAKLFEYTEGDVTLKASLSSTETHKELLAFSFQLSDLLTQLMSEHEQNHFNNFLHWLCFYEGKEEIVSSSMNI